MATGTWKRTCTARMNRANAWPMGTARMTANGQVCLVRYRMHSAQMGTDGQFFSMPSAVAVAAKSPEAALLSRRGCHVHALPVFSWGL